MEQRGVAHDVVDVLDRQALPPVVLVERRGVPGPRHVQPGERGPVGEVGVLGPVADEAFVEPAERLEVRPRQGERRRPGEP